MISFGMIVINPQLSPNRFKVDQGFRMIEHFLKDTLAFLAAGPMFFHPLSSDGPVIIELVLQLSCLLPQFGGFFFQRCACSRAS